MSEPSLKLQTARSVKWNAIDRLSSQVLYALTGVVLANILSPADFGLVGAVLIFQAFASLLIDSGFSYALIQRKHPTRLDYSSVLWFNIGTATVLYVILWISAPLIADFFDHELRLIPLSRVMFVTFVLNASSIVQVNMLTKQMNVRPVAIANVISLTAGGVIGIVLALMGYGAWALVWQSIVNSGLKSAILWASGRWTPLMRCSWRSIRGFFGVGGSMMATSLLNTIFLNIYSIFIGNRAGMVSLGYYTQSDKWSKMGIMSLLQTFTSSFLSPLSAVQDDPERYRALCSKMNRMTAYLLFPIMIGLIIMAAPIFHTLFGDKWDASIELFQLLIARGILTVLTGIYNNYIIALGKSKAIVAMEIVRDGVALIALIITLPYISIETPTDIVYGVKLLIYGQIIASLVAWAVTLVSVCRITGSSIWMYLRDLCPYMALTAVISPLLIWIGMSESLPQAAVLAAQATTGVALYLGLNFMLKSRIQADVLAFMCGKLKK